MAGRPTHNRFRRTTEWLVLLSVAVCMLRVWFVEGAVFPLKVVSGSMAEGLRGRHREVNCLDCGRHFHCASDAGPISPRAVCPNCGFAGNDLLGRPDIEGDRLLIQKSVFSVRSPRRWEPVAFRHPQRAGDICIKRLVGLPGESILINHGDIYVDGGIQRKSLDEQRAMAVLVHDAALPPKRTIYLPRRWQGDREDSRWVQDGRSFSLPPVDGASIDWLRYCHWHRIPGQPGKTRQGPILNYRGYNQTGGQRAENVRPVSDLLLSFRVARIHGSGELLLWATDGRDEFQVEMRLDQLRLRVSHNGKRLSSLGSRLPPLEGTCVELSLFDRQFLLAFDGDVAAVYPYNPSASEPRPTSRPLAIGAGGLDLEIGDIQVYRDVYYTHPIGFMGRWGLDEPVRLGSDEYFVLGDNSLVSEDSRTWTHGPAVPEKLLFGRPFLVHFPAQRVQLGRWHLQVPDLAKIRYIR